jgi:hypothetical protein
MKFDILWCLPEFVGTIQFYLQLDVKTWQNPQAVLVVMATWEIPNHWDNSVAMSLAPFTEVGNQILEDTPHLLRLAYIS